MFKWLQQKLLNNKIFSQSAPRKGIRRFLNHPELVSLDRHSIALGVAIGLFCSILPIFQTIIACIFAIFIRANLPIAALLTWINNPFTFLPITYFTYLIGDRFINDNSKEIVIQQFSWKYGTLHEQWTSLIAWISQYSKPYFVGMIILSFTVGLLGYFAFMIPWKKFLLFEKSKNSG